MKATEALSENKVINKQLGNLFLIFILLSGLNILSCKKKTVEEPKPTPLSIPKSSLKLPSKVLFYYAWPSAINLSNFDVNKAIPVFKQYDMIILGRDIEKTSHGDYSNTKQVIAELNKVGKKVFGYIDVGNTQSLSITQLKDAINGWKTIGAVGVFGDEFDSQYKVDRTRQNEFINYAHQSGMGVFANGFSVEEVLGGENCLLDKRDFYLLESFGYGHGKYFTLAQTIERGTLAHKYKESRGVGIISVATIGTNIVEPNSDKTDAFLHGYIATLMFNFDGFCFSDENYSASGPNANKAFIYSDPFPNYGNRFMEGEFVKKVSDTQYSTSTDTHIINLTDKSGSITKK